MMATRFVGCVLAVGAVMLGFSSSSFAQELRKPHVARKSTPPDLTRIVEPENRMRPIVRRFVADSRDMRRIYQVSASTERLERMAQFYSDWKAALGSLDFDSFNMDARIDYILLGNKLDYELLHLEMEKSKLGAALRYLPFAEAIVALEESRRRFEPMNPESTAAVVAGIAGQIEEKKKEIVAALEGGELEVSLETATLAERSSAELGETLEEWFAFYNGYDPLFTWWVEAPYRSASEAIEEYAKWLGETLKSDVDEFEAWLPAGREVLVAELESALIPYTPEEIIAIGEAEYAWCVAELRKASNEMGYGDDWPAAMEHVKTLHAAPGEQPRVIADLAFEAVKFLRDNDLITIDQMAVDTWRLEMMSPERQRVSPFFLGGPSIIVSFPTDTMDHDFKRMSMRGNNIHFARATVQHELIPGHHLQFYSVQRNNPHRSRVFGTPFWIEGWALYWEMLLWELDFPQSPENRMGMLFWRTHRAARIVFSFKFHMGQMTARECIEMLIEGVGHEPSTAEAEVRRSFQGGYNPIYQAAYLVGGLQFRALKRELVDSGGMSYREFHDAVIRNSVMPVEMVRAALTGQELARDFESSWNFYGDVEAAEK